MKRFTELYRRIDASTSTHKKVAALVDYFASAPPSDAAWAAYFLAGGKPRQVVPTAVLREMACEIAGIDAWIFEAGYAVTGDLAEAIAYVLPPPTAACDDGLATWMEQHVLPLRAQPREQQRASVARAWSMLDPDERFILIKLIGGGFRVGISKLLVQRALAQVSGQDAKVIAQRMMGYTDAKQQPDADRYGRLVNPEAGASTEQGQPYPFFLAHQLDGPADALGDVSAWTMEWKYDGIRAQVVVRDGRVHVWSRGEELITERFPEVVAQAQALPNGTVLDGEILAWQPGGETPLPFARLQQRIGRSNLTKKVLADAPVIFLAYDCLETEGIDRRSLPQTTRGALLGQVCGDAGIAVSPQVAAESWSELAALRSTSRARGVEGLMLKHRSARYGVGRTRGDGIWWKWKIEPMTADCVLIYAQAGHGRRANLYTDYTFAVWSRPPVDDAEATAVLDAIAARQPAKADGLQLVAFAKAYSGLTDVEFTRVDKVIRKTTVDKFGPVRSVRPSMVFELGFEGIGRSTRHKSGIATRFPRMLRIRDDKLPWQADSLLTLQVLAGLSEGVDEANPIADPNGALDAVAKAAKKDARAKPRTNPARASPQTGPEKDVE